MLRRGASAVLALSLAACADAASVAPPAPQPIGLDASQSLFECRVEVQARQVECRGQAPVLAAGVRGSALYGGQNTMVRLTSSNVSYDAGTGKFGFDVTVTNLLSQAIGTKDGVSADSAGTKVFFARGPSVTAGTGTAAVANEDGSADFTGAGQPFFRYSGVLAAGATSAAKHWELDVPPTADAVTFGVYITTEVEPRVVINEIMANPGGTVQDSVGEYVELYNAGRFPVNLKGFTVADNAPGAETITTDLVIPAGGFAVIGRSRNTAVNGGINPDFAYSLPTTSTSLTFSNSGADRYVLKTPTGVTVDSVAYTSSSVAAKSGVARELKDPSLDNTQVDGSNWTDATSVYDAANNNKGTPGARNTGAPDTGTPVPPGPPATVTLSAASGTLAPGATRQYTATARDASNQVTSTTFTWASSDSTVARVSATGLVTAVAEGQTVISATSANGKVGTSTLTVAAGSGPSGVIFRNHLEFGIPTDGNSSDDILLSKREYALSYNASRGGPNWVSWDLNKTHFGPANRCNCFAADPTLPNGVYRVVTSDYTGSGYSRGHMVMSEQRTATPEDNEQTFLMTNILPQIQDMNGGPWLQFEVYTNDLARSSDKEVYNIAGPVWGTATLNNAGKVTIPTSTWKIIVVLPYGKGLADVTSASDIQVIAVNMPNVAGIQSQPWSAYRTTVDAIEAATGYDFLSALPDEIEAVVEAN